MAQNELDKTSKQCIVTKSEFEKVKESIEKKELQNSILRLLVKEIRNPGTPTTTDETANSFVNKTQKPR